MYIDNDSIDFYQGSVFYSSLSRGSTGECALASTQALHLEGKAVMLNAPFYHVHIDCSDSQTSDNAFSVNAAGSKAKFTANDLILKTPTKEISVSELGNKMPCLSVLNVNITQTASVQTYASANLKGKPFVLVYISCGTNHLNRTVVLFPDVYTGWQTYQDASYYISGKIMFSPSAGTISYSIDSVKGWSAGGFKISKIAC